MKEEAPREEVVQAIVDALLGRERGVPDSPLANILATQVAHQEVLLALYTGLTNAYPQLTIRPELDEARRLLVKASRSIGDSVRELANGQKKL